MGVFRNMYYCQYVYLYFEYRKFTFDKSAYWKKFEE